MLYAEVYAGLCSSTISSFPSLLGFLFFPHFPHRQFPHFLHRGSGVCASSALRQVYAELLSETGLPWPRGRGRTAAGPRDRPLGPGRLQGKQIAKHHARHRCLFTCYWNCRGGHSTLANDIFSLGIAMTHQASAVLIRSGTLKDIKSHNQFPAI